MKREYKNESGQLHRTDGPAVEYSDGSKEWYINGKLSRTDGLPTIEWSDGSKFWFINGEVHREDGPAVEYSNDRSRYYLNNIEYSEEEYQNELIKLKLKRLVNL